MPGTRTRSAVATLVGVLLLAGCGSGRDTPPDAGPDVGAAGGGAAACVAGLRYDDTFYLHVDTRPLTPGEALEGAEVPLCNDTGGAEEDPMPVGAFAVQGVDPRYAVLADGGAEQMTYVSEHYAPGLRDAQPLPDDVAAVLGLR
jgi:hypothetical protein